MKKRNLFILLLIGLIGIWYLASRLGHTTKHIRPNDPWVFRSVMDKQPRMITFALNNDLWVSYSTDSCSLYKAWPGGVDFTGAVYNMRHGPQPMSIGAAWLENKFRQPWTVTLGGKTEAPRTDYKGHRYTKDGRAEIMYDLVLSDGQRIRINERPDYVEHDRQRGFERTFTVENAPAGAGIVLHTSVASIADPSNITTNGGWKQTHQASLENRVNLSALAVEGELTLLADRPTHFTTMFVNQPLLPNPFDAERLAEASGETGAGTVSAGEKLMAKSDCRTCHNAEVKTVGPGYRQIAERYKNVPEVVEKLVQKVMKGGAGVWGAAAMSAHPDLQPEDATAMVNYVLSLDEGEDDGEGGESATKLSDIPESSWVRPDASVSDGDVASGLSIKVYNQAKAPLTFKEVRFDGDPMLAAVVGNLNAQGADFGPLKDNFAIVIEGFLFLDKDDNVLFQLGSDDGSRMWIDGRQLIDNDGWHGMEPKEAEVALRAGYHPIRVEYFQAGGGRGIQLKWARFGNSEMAVVPENAFFHKRSAETDGNGVVLGGGSAALPGDGSPLQDVHPAYTLTQARPDEFLPKVAGMDFLPDGRLVVSTWDALGAVYLLDNVQSGDPAKIKVKRIAQGLAEPLGIKVVDGVIYALQKQELTKLVDTDGDDIIDEYQCFAKGWRASANFHEFAFGLVYKEGYFYAALAIAINPGGASTRPQGPDRGKVLRINAKDGSMEFIARGLRTPDGVGIGPDGEIFIADNQGDWLPSSKILHVKPGAFYNS
ncbi:MAG: c-type cytochrome, partial [Saprospiraceae bacterium]|nr:c-type cytochrome [Saprospiraceae bacterium]